MIVVAGTLGVTAWQLKAGAGAAQGSVAAAAPMPPPSPVDPAAEWRIRSIRVRAESRLAAGVTAPVAAPPAPTLGELIEADPVFSRYVRRFPDQGTLLR